MRDLPRERREPRQFTEEQNYSEGAQDGAVIRRRRWESWHGSHRERGSEKEGLLGGSVLRLAIPTGGSVK